MKIAVVTGAGKGLGREIATGLSAKGFAVLVTDIDGEAAERGTLALWVNNAGVLHTGHAWDHADELVREMTEVNVLGMIWGARAAIAAMRDDGGHVINIASLSSITPVPGLAVYGATKQAVLGFTISLAGDLERAKLPIEVSAVCPDGIDTDMVSSQRGNPQAGLVFATRKLLTVEEVADVVLDLVDRPKLAVGVPRSRAALAHVMRPFPTMSLKILKPVHRFGERQRLKSDAES